METSAISNFSVAALDGVAAGAKTMDHGAQPFAGLVTDAVHTVESLDQQASSAVEGLMTGSGVDIHEAMIATQKASLSFEMALALRNKAVGAYQQIMQMQF